MDDRELGSTRPRFAGKTIHSLALRACIRRFTRLRFGRVFWTTSTEYFFPPSHRPKIPEPPTKGYQPALREESSPFRPARVAGILQGGELVVRARSGSFAMIITDKTAVVTGAGSGIGQAVAVELAERGVGGRRPGRPQRQRDQGRPDRSTTDGRPGGRGHDRRHDRRRLPPEGVRPDVQQVRRAGVCVPAAGHHPRPARASRWTSRPARRRSTRSRTSAWSWRSTSSRPSTGRWR